MLAKVLSGATIGLDGVLIEVEVDVASQGFPAFNMVGLPGKAVDEAKERVRAAVVNASFEMPDTRITVNLAPADIPKTGSALDLPIAVGILTAAGMIKKESISNSLFLGELSLKGDLRKVPGVVSIALLAKAKKINQLFVPRENIREAALVDGIEVYPVDSLVDLILHLNGEKNIFPYPHQDFLSLIKEEKQDYLFEDVKGQETVKRALEIAAAGFHNLILKGPPGTGKTLLSRAFPSILPSMEKEEILEVTKIYSVAGLLQRSFFIASRPFRSPHHTTSRIGLVGGGSHPGPGEISLAHRGVLFLDELPEFPRSTLEALRQPLEDGFITISRAAGSLTFPSRFLLLAAFNPCPCGYLGHPKKSCRCLPGSILKYKKRLSGPLLDRIDLHVDVAPVEEEKLTTDFLAESSEKVRIRVGAAREVQKKRFQGRKIYTNGEMSSAEVKKFCRLTNESINLLKQAISRLSLSARSYFKTIKISQTIADLNGKEIIDASYVAEALQFRSHDE
jgi:magnesium chelatase family protein